MNMKETLSKRLYETVLSSKQQPVVVFNTLHTILRLAFEDSFHFSFLLNRVPWFQPPFINFLEVLEKTIRLYRSKGKQAAKVGYHLLVEGLTIPEASDSVLQCIYRVTQGQWNWKILIKCLQENYPHKVCSTTVHVSYLNSLIALSKRFPTDRYQILEMIVQNLVLIDTQLLEGDQLINQPFPPDIFIKQLRESQKQSKNISEIGRKFDTLLTRFLQYIDQIKSQPNLLKQLFLLFQKKILVADGTKIVQFIIFYVAQQTKKTASTFACFLLGNILSQYDSTIDKAFVNTTFYLFSYIARSTNLSFNQINKITEKMVDFLLQKVKNISKIQCYQKIDMHKLRHQNLKYLYMLQVILTNACYHPAIRSLQDHKLKILLQESHNKILYQMFIHEEIIAIIGQEQKVRCQDIKFQNKFNPPISGEVCTFIDPIIRWNFQLGGKRKQDCKIMGAPGKKVKIGYNGSTPVSIVSGQDSTYKY